MSDLAPRPAPRPIDEATKRRVLARAEEIGINAAAREAGVRPGTARMWRSRKRIVVAEETPSQRKERAALDAWDAAQAALAKVNEMLAEGKTLDAQRAALAFAILVDKSHLLNEQALAGRGSDEWTLNEIDAEIARLSAAFPEPEPLPVVEGRASKVESLGRAGVAAAPVVEGGPAEPAAASLARAPAPAKRRLRDLLRAPEPEEPELVPRDLVAELHWDESEDVWQRLS